MTVAGFRCQRLVAVLLAVVCVCMVAEGNPWYHRIIAVGDVHGDKHNFKRVLRMAQLTHESTNFNSWNFCGINSTIPVHRTTLVQMGDLVDRGDDDHGVLKMASSLLQEVNSNETSEDEAVFLIGNHELMNLEGAFQFVNHNHGGYRNAEARKAAFATNGVASQLILNHFRAIYVAEDTIFVHAGMDAFHGIRLEYIDETIRGAIKAGNYGHPLLGSRGPLWTRHMIFNAVKGKCKDVERMLHHYNAKRIVVGHTIQRRGIGMYCDGRVFAVDVGISRWVHDNVRALEILVKHDGDRFEVVVSELTEHSGSQVLFRSTHASTTDDSNAL